MLARPWVVLVLAACVGDIDGEKVCSDVGVAIAAKTLECTGDEELANDRYDAFEEATTCLVGATENEDPGALYACHSAIRAMSCGEAQAYGDEIGAWLSAGGCGSVVSYEGSWVPPEEV